MVNQASAASGHEPAMTMPCGNIRMISFTKPPTIRFVAATFFAVSLVLSSAATHRPPDIVIFLTDDQSRLDASPYGSILRTSNMQRLAVAGLTFTRAFVASPSCAPSRAALLTGLMPARNGAEANQTKPRPDIKKWPAYFQELGYEVAAFGKVSHYGHTRDYGFDHFEHDTFHDPEGIPSAVQYLKHRRSAPLRHRPRSVGGEHTISVQQRSRRAVAICEMESL